MVVLVEMVVLAAVVVAQVEGSSSQSRVFAYNNFDSMIDVRRACTPGT